MTVLVSKARQLMQEIAQLSMMPHQMGLVQGFRNVG